MTTKTARQALAVLITSWLTSPSAEYDLDDALIDVTNYTTVPDPNGAKPFHVVVGSERATSSSEGVAESDSGTFLYLALFARINTDDEVTKEVAENWLDDCEEYLTKQMEASRNTNDWTRLQPRSIPRDRDPTYHKLYRVAYIRIGVDLR